MKISDRVFSDKELIFEDPFRELEIFVEDKVLDESDHPLSLGEIPEHTLISQS